METTRSPAKAAARKVFKNELDLAEERGAARVRAEVQDALDDGRRVVRQGDQQIEVVEAAVIEAVLVTRD